jgi:hypothetical protein
MALRKYKRRTAGVEQSALSEAADTKPAEATPPPVTTPKPPAQEPVSAAQADPVLESPSSAPTPQAAPSANEAAMSFKMQLEQMRQGQQQRTSADAAHIAAMASTPIEQQLDRLPNLSVLQKAYLRERPFALNRLDVLTQAHHWSLDNQIPVDSPQYFQVMDQALQTHANIPFTTPPTATPVACTDTAPRESENPMPQQHTAQSPQPEADEYNPAIHSAPVSRGDYGPLGQTASSNRVTLSAEERDICARSGLKEVDYARNKLKLTQMKKAGLVRD